MQTLMLPNTHATAKLQWFTQSGTGAGGAAPASGAEQRVCRNEANSKTIISNPW